MLLLILLFTTILEKLQWTILGLRCNIFMLYGIVFCILTFLTKRVKFRSTNRKILLVFLLELFYIICQTPLIIFSDYDLQSQFLKGMAFFSAESFILIFMTRYIENTKNITFNDIIKYVYGISICNIVYCIIQRFNPDIDNILVTFFQSTVTRYGLDLYGALGRITGLFTDSNNNGVFLVFTFCIAIYLYNISYENHRKGFAHFGYLLASLSSLVLIVMTFSRTASIGIMVVILMMTFHYNLNKKVQLFILFFIGMYIFSSYYLTNDYFAAMIDDRLSSMDINEIFNNSHVSVLLAAFSIYFSSILIFLFGTGYNCLHIYYTLFTQFPDFKAHSYFVQTLVELGIPGLIICLSLFVILFKIISSGNKYPALRQKCFLMRCILISGFIMNCTYDSFNQPSLFIVLALFMVFSTEVKIETNNFLIESKKD
jgi:hypothetical protein